MDRRDGGMDLVFGFDIEMSVDVDVDVGRRVEVRGKSGCWGLRHEPLALCCGGAVRRRL